MIRIIIADDHEIIRAGLKQIIAEQSGMKVTEEASDGYELLDKIRINKFDVLLLDIQMPGPSGLEIIKQLKCEDINIPILVLTIHPENKYAIRALKAGASGYLTKVTASEELVGAIKKVYSGGKYISPSLAEQLAHSIINKQDKPPHEYLSDREYQVASRIASGETLTQISNALSLSVKTISTYRHRTMEKMNMKNNAELTHYMISNNLTLKT